MRFILDSHPENTLHFAYDQLNGWIEHPVGTQIEFRIGDTIQVASTYQRPDLDPNAACGFTLYIDLVSLDRDRLIGDANVSMGVYIDAEKVYEHSFKISLTHQDLAKIRDNKRKRRSFAMNHWKGEKRYRSDVAALCALPDSWTLAPELSKNLSLVCRHHYDGMIYDFLESRGPNAMFLEIGAGLRFTPVANVLTVEIYDYPSTDVLAVAESLPFEDATFDGALALNVLEHVRDPFVCARELRRVVKPGGKIYVMMPFMAAEHGYPSHYFNATRSGIRQLFDGCAIEKHIVHPSSHPIGSLGYFILTYADGLPASTREIFLDMSARQLMELSTERDHPVIRQLDAETTWKIAWATTAIFVNSHC